MEIGRLGDWEIGHGILSFFFLNGIFDFNSNATQKTKKNAMDTRVLSWIFFFEDLILILLCLQSIHNILNVWLIYAAPAYSGEVNNDINCFFVKNHYICVCVFFYLAILRHFFQVEAYSIMCIVFNPQHVQCLCDS